RVEQRRVAADAVVLAGLEQRAQLRAERPLGARAPRDVVLLVAELRPPFRVALLHTPRRRHVAALREVDDLGSAQDRRVVLRGAHELRPLGAGAGAARQPPIRPREMTRVTAGVTQQIVLMLGLGFPEWTRGTHLRDGAARPEPGRVDVGDRLLGRLPL